MSVEGSEMTAESKQLVHCSGTEVTGEDSREA